MRKPEIKLTEKEWRLVVVSLETEIRRAMVHAAELRAEADRLGLLGDDEELQIALNARASREETHTRSCQDVLSTVLHTLGWKI